MNKIKHILLIFLIYTATSVSGEINPKVDESKNSTDEKKEKASSELQLNSEDNWINAGDDRTSPMNIEKDSDSNISPLRFNRWPFRIGAGLEFATLRTDDINELLYDLYLVKMVQNGEPTYYTFDGRLSNSIKFVPKLSFTPYRFITLSIIGKIGLSHDSQEHNGSAYYDQESNLMLYSGGVTLDLNIKAYNSVYPRVGGGWFKTYSKLSISNSAGDVIMSGDAIEASLYLGLGIQFHKAFINIDFGTSFGEIPFSLESSTQTSAFPFNYDRKLNLFGFNTRISGEFKFGKIKS